MKAMTTTLRNSFFLKGIIFGGVFGLLVGLLAAFQASNAHVNTVKGNVVTWRHRKQQPDYSQRYV